MNAHIIFIYCPLILYLYIARPWNHLKRSLIYINIACAFREPFLIFAHIFRITSRNMHLTTSCLCRVWSFCILVNGWLKKKWLSEQNEGGCMICKWSLNYKSHDDAVALCISEMRLLTNIIGISWISDINKDCRCIYEKIYLEILNRWCYWNIYIYILTLL